MPSIVAKISIRVVRGQTGFFWLLPVVGGRNEWLTREAAVEEALDALDGKAVPWRILPRWEMRVPDLVLRDRDVRPARVVDVWPRLRGAALTRRRAAGR